MARAQMAPSIGGEKETIEMSADNTSTEAKGQPPVTFTLDGVEYTVTDRRQLAADVLRLAGLDPADYDLLRIVGKDKEQRFEDKEEVQLVPGGRYLSLFTGPTPVV
ncbi:MAG: multiubiquitin domain-containing protein [Actinomycetota bacterium]